MHPGVCGFNSDGGCGFFFETRGLVIGVLVIRHSDGRRCLVGPFFDWSVGSL